MSTELSAGRTAVAARKELLVRDIKGVIGDADDLLKEVASSTADGFAAACTKLEARLVETRSRLDNARTAVAARAKGAADATYEYVAENPWKVIGAGAVAGLVAGLLLLRRR